MTTTPEVFARRLEQSARELEPEWRRDWSKEVADEMSRRAPRDTGRLAASMRVTDEGVVADVAYAVYVARGTSRMAPRPFDLEAVAAVIKDAAEGAGDLVIRELT